MSRKKITQQIVVGSIIFYKRKILILKRNHSENFLPNFWELPSGKKRLSEGIKTCLIRETKEEAGILVKPMQVFNIFEYKIEKKDEIKKCIQINYFVNLVKKMKISLSDEHKDFTWISEKELYKYKMSKKTTKTIQKAFLFIKENGIIQ